jgi:hypothetical protein
MWIKSSVNLNAGDLQLLLDDTAQCPSPLETLNIPAVPANNWQYVTMTLSNPSSCTAIISIGIKMVVDKGAFTLRVDDIKAGSLVTDTDFENATQAGGPTPKNQGNTQIFSVEGLESNTIYWFAVKSKDDLDNVSSLSTQNPFGKTGLLYDWNMVSCPLQPSPDDSMSVFGDDAGLLDWMWYWQSTWTGSTDTDCETGCKTVGCLPTCYCHPDCDGDWGQISNIAPGEGILLYSYATDNPTDATGTDITNASVTLSLNAGWNLIGNPYGESVNLSDCEVSYTSTESYVNALSYVWIGNAVYIWNGSTYDFIQWDEAKLEPWKGYWIFASYNLDLIIHTPSP